MTTNPFHLTLLVNDFLKAVEFYRFVFNAVPLTAGSNWQDFDFYGNQLTLVERPELRLSPPSLQPDGGLPVPHFGAIVTIEEIGQIRAKLGSLKTRILIDFTKNQNTEREWGKICFADPSYNPIEIKAFRSVAYSPLSSGKS